jgi:putative nucleotidyltransferase with HDIG domain
VSDWRSSSKAEELVAGVTELSVPAPTVVTLIGLLNRPDVDQAAVEEVVERDSVLSAKLLALANSAYFGLARPVASLREVLFYLGHTEVYRLAIAVSLSGILSRKAQAYAMDEGQLWRHSLLTAKCAENLAVSSSPSVRVDESAAYTAGLLHDIGKIIFNQALPTDMQRELNSALENAKKSGRVIERDLLGTDHAEVGACLLDQWKLPRPIVQAVAFHQKVPAEGLLDMASMVYFANETAHIVQNGRAAEPGRLAMDAARVGLPPDSIQRLISFSSELLPRLDQLRGAGRAGGG